LPPIFPPSRQFARPGNPSAGTKFWVKSLNHNGYSCNSAFQPVRRGGAGRAFAISHSGMSRAMVLTARLHSPRQNPAPPAPDIFFASSITTEWEDEMISLSINGQSHNADVEDSTPLLWVLRDTIGMTGTKYGCGIAQCGACTVHVDGVAMRSCSIPVSAVAGKQITTIEGIAVGGKLSAVQQAWLDNDVPQCGYCQSGMIMAVTALLKQKPKPTDADIDAAITNICRCGTYQQIRAAIHAAANA
jgi:isoquinoline 1-oxidoreductase alpha subunit